MDAYRARYVVPVDAPPIEDGVIQVVDGRITSVGRYAGQTARDLGDVALMPAWVNAHTHLEFSDLQEPLGDAGMVFADWIALVIHHRRNLPPTSASRLASIHQGLSESRDAGVLTLGDIVTSPTTLAAFREAGIGGTAFFELLGLDPSRQETLLAAAVDFGQELAAGRFTTAYSPHAPYTVSLEFLERIVGQANLDQRPVAMHLAETREELALLGSHSGPLHELFERMGIWRPEAIPKGTTIHDYLLRLSQAEHALVIHGNYLTNDEISAIAENREKMSVVYCPRTHKYFGHEDYPIERLVNSGIRVALGTDSRASNPDLSLLAEVRTAAMMHPTMAPRNLVQMATQNGATALQRERESGSLTVGKLANFVTIPLEPAADPYEAIVYGDTEMTHVIQGGRLIVG